MLKLKLQVLKKYINIVLALGFIIRFKLLAKALILFIEKMNRVIESNCLMYCVVIKIMSQSMYNTNLYDKWIAKALKG